MNNIRFGTIYLGNLMQRKNNKIELYKEAIYLVYESKTNKFYSLLDTLNYFMDIDLNKNLTEEEKENYMKIIKKYEYSHIPSKQEGQIYVDINSLKEITNTQDNQRNNHR